MLITAELRKPRSSSETAQHQLLLLQLCRGGLGMMYYSYSEQNLQALGSFTALRQETSSIHLHPLPVLQS